MSTNLEKAKRQRIRISDYYANGWQFIIRLIMGLGIYVVVRIILMSILTRSAGISFTLCDTLAEISVLLITAALMILFIWFKGSRSHLVAAVWMPAVACLVVSDLIRFILILTQPYAMDAWQGFLPFLLPLILMILYWIFDPDKILFKVLGTLLFLGLSVFWVTDIPLSLQEAKDLQTVVTAYQTFSQDIKEEHIIYGEQIPDALVSGRVYSQWESLDVNPEHYLIDPEIPAIDRMYYVSEALIILPGMKKGLNISDQELSFSTLDQIALHYFFKYVTERHIVIHQFQYTGDAFFLLELKNGEKIAVDNVLIRKK